MAPAAPACVRFREVRPGDVDALRAAHARLFPLQYEREFYDAVRSRGEGVECIVAVAARGAYEELAAGEDGGSEPAASTVGEEAHPLCPDTSKGPLWVGDAAEGEALEELVGFVTWRQMAETDVDAGLLAADSHPCKPANGGAPAALGQRCGAYVLTLGSVSRWQRRGVAAALLQRAVGGAQRVRRCKCIYLHVATYNTAAIRLYEAHGFRRARKLEKFYVIDQSLHDAFSLIRYCNGGHRPLSDMPVPEAAITVAAGLVSSLWQSLRSFGGGMHMARVAGDGSDGTSAGAEGDDGSTPMIIPPAAIAMVRAASRAKNHRDSHCARRATLREDARRLLTLRAALSTQAGWHKPQRLPKREPPAGII